MTKVLGIDVGAKFVVAFSLERLPVGVSYPDYYKQNAKICLSKIKINNKSEQSTVKIEDAIALLTELKPDAIVMEPTGVWYSKVWAKMAEHLGIEVKWIGHGDLAHNRGAYGFKDKDDRTDAYCLALSYFDVNFNASNRWLYWRVGIIDEVNSVLLELESLKTTNKIFQQQLRQRLHYEFPEIVKRSINNSRTKDGFTGWVGWLAGIHNYTLINNQHKKSIAIELGIEISQYTRDHAACLAGGQIRETALQFRLGEIILDRAFDKYRPTLDMFGFGDKTKGVVLSQIYPFEKFLLDGKPWIDRYEDDRGWKKKNRSLAAFQISLGMGKRLIESGGSSVLIYSGSSFARSKLYVWIMSCVMPERCKDTWLVNELDRRALSNPKPALTVAQLRTRWQTTKGSNSDKHKAGARSAMTLAYRITRLLYDNLLQDILC